MSDNKKDDVYLDHLLTFDALSTAQRITKESYKEDKATEALGMGMFFENRDARRAQLAKMGDTQFHNTVADYVAILTELQFEKVLEIPFTVKRSYDKEERHETFYMYWNKEDGMLIVFDTYYSSLDKAPSVNAANLYYNWQAPSWEAVREHSRCLSSGGPFNENIVWGGHHDAREALKFHIRKLKEGGKLLPVWEQKVFLWFRHHGDPNFDYKANDYSLEVSRFKMLPEYVQKAIKIDNEWEKLLTDKEDA